MFQMKGVTSHHHFQVTVTHISFHFLTIQNWHVLRFIHLSRIFIQTYQPQPDVGLHNLILLILK